MPCCSICQRADVAAIDEAIAKRDGLAVERALATAYGVPALSLHRHAAHRQQERAALRREILGAVEPGERVTAGDVFYRLERRLPGLTREEAAAGLERLNEEGLLGRSGAQPRVYNRPA